MIKYVELGVKTLYITVWKDYIEFYPMHKYSGDEFKN
jgi:hypothetical protein